MRNLLGIICLLFSICFLSCGTQKFVSFDNYYFYQETKSPQRIVDSLSAVYNLGVNDYHQWNDVRPFWINNNVAIYTYTTNGYRNDSLFVMTVSEDIDSVFTIKFRIEPKR